MLIFYNFVRCGDCTMFLVTAKCLAETPELSEEIKGLSLIWNFYNLTYYFPKSYILGKVILLDKKCYIYGFLWGETLLSFSWLLDRLVLVSGEHKNPRTTQPISGFSALPFRPFVLFLTNQSESLLKRIFRESLVSSSLRSKERRLEVREWQRALYKIQLANSEHFINFPLILHVDLLECA